jgi:MFS family permease
MSHTAPALITDPDFSMSEINLDAPSVKSDETKLEFPSKSRRYALLGIFAMTLFIDGKSCPDAFQLQHLIILVLGASAFFVFTGAVSKDLDIIFAQQSWVISSYSVTFAAFLVFWGKLCELLGSKRVFVPALFCVGALSLVLSFLTDKYAFFVLRGFTGLAAAALVPSSYRLIALAFPLEERSKAYTLYGMTGSIANVTGTIVAGVIALIPEGLGRQMAPWRWFFRMLAAIA